METFTYNLCLLITFKDNLEIMIIRMQTNDTLILGDIKFLVKKQVKIDRVEFSMKLV